MILTTSTKQWRPALLATLVVALGTLSANAANDIWDGANGDFSDNANWQDNTAPLDTDIAIFNTGGFTVNFPVHEITNQLHVNALNLTFDLNGKTYSNDGIPFVSSSLIAVGDTANGSLTLGSTSAGGKLAADSLNIGSATASGTVTVNSNATLEIAGGINLGDFANVGTLVLNGGTVQTSDLSSSFPGNGILTYNSGDLTVTGSVFLNSGSAIEVNNGTLTSSGFASFQNGLTANAGGIINLSGSSNIAGSGITLAGGSVNISSGFHSVSAISGGAVGWTGGMITYGSNLSIGTGGVLGSSITLDDRSLTVSSGSSLTIQASGTLVVDKTTHGTLTADAITIDPNANFEYGTSGGDISLQSGSLAIGNPASGRMTGPSDSTSVNIGGGNSVALADGTMTIDTGYTLSTGGGKLITDQLVNNGTLTYSGGDIEVEMQPLVIGGGSGGGHINGSTTISIPVTDIIRTQSTLTVDPSYTVNVSGTLSAELSIAVDGEIAIGSTGNVTTLGGVTVGNGGSLEINGGNLSVGTLTTAAGGTTTFNGGLVSINAGNLLIGVTGGINAPQPTIIGLNDSIAVSFGTTSIDDTRTLSLQGGSLYTSMFDETSLGTLEFHGGLLHIGNDDIEIGPNGIDGPQPTVLNTSSHLLVAPLAMSGGNLSVVSGRDLQLSGGFVHAKTLSVAGRATFTAGTLWLTGVGENLHIVDPTPGAGGISDPDGPVIINLNSSIRVLDGSVTIDAGQALHLAGGDLRTQSIQEDEVNSFTYSGGNLQLLDSNLVIGPGAAANDQRFIGATPVLTSGDNVSIEDPDFNLGTRGNTTIESGGSLSIHGGNFHTTANLTINAGGSLSGYDPGSIPYGGLGGFVEVPMFSPASVLTNNGDISPGYTGSEIGELHYSGDYLQGASGELHIQFTELVGFEMSDRLTIGGKATLGGTLTVTFLGYGWVPGDEFTLLTAAQIIGEFDTINYPTLPPGVMLVVDYNYPVFGGTGLHFTVTPEPTSFLLLLLSLLGVLRFRRRR